MLSIRNTLDSMFQALADPGRRLMVERLSRGPASVTQLAEPLKMSLSAVVQHLQVLEASGLVKSERLGGCAPASSSRRRSAAEKWISERRTLWERRLDRLGNFWLRSQKNENKELVMPERTVTARTTSSWIAPTILSRRPVFRGVGKPRSQKHAGSYGPANGRKSDYKLKNFRVGRRRST